MSKLPVSTVLFAAIVSITALSLFVASASAQAPSSWPTPKQPEKPLDKVAVVSLIEEFSRDLWDLLSDEEAAEAIVEKWKERKDLVGKTRSQAVHILFEDVRAEVDDSKKASKVWDRWEPTNGTHRNRRLSRMTAPKPRSNKARSSFTANFAGTDISLGRTAQSYSFIRVRSSERVRPLN